MSLAIHFDSNSDDEDDDYEVRFFTSDIKISHCATCKKPELQEMLGRNEFTGSPCCERCGFETAADWRDFDHFAKKLNKFCNIYMKRRAFTTWTKKEKLSEVIST